jgi:hypothetical protein
MTGKEMQARALRHSGMLAARLDIREQIWGAARDKGGRERQAQAGWPPQLVCRLPASITYRDG